MKRESCDGGEEDTFKICFKNNKIHLFKNGDFVSLF